MKIKRIVVIGTVAKVIIVTGIALAFSGNPKADQGHPDLAAVFNRNYQQYATTLEMSPALPLTHPGG